MKVTIVLTSKVSRGAAQIAASDVILPHQLACIHDFAMYPAVKDTVATALAADIAAAPSQAAGTVNLTVGTQARFGGIAFLRGNAFIPITPVSSMHRVSLYGHLETGVSLGRASILDMLALDPGNRHQTYLMRSIYGFKGADKVDIAPGTMGVYPPDASFRLASGNVVDAPGFVERRTEVQGQHITTVTEFGVPNVPVNIYSLGAGLSFTGPFGDLTYLESAGPATANSLWVMYVQSLYQVQIDDALINSTTPIPIYAVHVESIPTGLASGTLQDASDVLKGIPAYYPSPIANLAIGSKVGYVNILNDPIGGSYLPTGLATPLANLAGLAIADVYRQTKLAVYSGDGDFDLMAPGIFIAV